MSRQKRIAPQQVPGAASEQARAPSSEHAELDELQLGNQAHQDRLSAADASLEVVRDAASPLVERAILALQLEPRDAGEVERFVEIVERSRLGEERRDVLVDRLQTDRAAAEGIRDAVQRWFQADGPDVRESVVGALDLVLDSLYDGAPAGAEWALADGARVQLTGEALQGSLGSRAEALLRDVAAHVAPAVDSVAVQGFCRDVQLALLWDEEEEEELGEGYAAEESGA